MAALPIGVRGIRLTTVLHCRWSFKCLSKEDIRNIVIIKGDIRNIVIIRSWLDILCSDGVTQRTPVCQQQKKGRNDISSKIFLIFERKERYSILNFLSKLFQLHRGQWHHPICRWKYSFCQWSCWQAHHSDGQGQGNCICICICFCICFCIWIGVCIWFLCMIILTSASPWWPGTR